MQVIPKSLLLTSCSWDNGAYESFRMLPVLQECPYVEAFYDPVEKVLVVLSKDKKEGLTLVHKLDEYGNGMKKNNRPLVDRQRMVSFKEFYITKPEEIKQFINLFGFNANVFNYHRFLESYGSPQNSLKVVEAEAGDPSGKNPPPPPKGEALQESLDYGVVLR